jgi:hypothetical protein
MAAAGARFGGVAVAATSGPPDLRVWSDAVAAHQADALAVVIKFPATNELTAKSTER